jgi:hypothetical protein
MTFTQAHLRNRGSRCYWIREKVENPKGKTESTDDSTCGGCSRSSNETSVMEEERRAAPDEFLFVLQLIVERMI